jgi:hypothetical protein
LMVVFGNPGATQFGNDNTASPLVAQAQPR